MEEGAALLQTAFDEIVERVNNDRLDGVRLYDSVARIYQEAGISVLTPEPVTVEDLVKPGPLHQLCERIAPDVDSISTVVDVEQSWWVEVTVTDHRAGGSTYWNDRLAVPLELSAFESHWEEGTLRDVLSVEAACAAGFYAP